MMRKSTKFLYNPDKVSRPGTTLVHILSEHKMTRQRLAERLLMPLQTINDIIKGEVAISAEIAIRLESIFGTAAEFWISRETNYRAFMAVTQGLNELERIRKYEWAR